MVSDRRGSLPGDVHTRTALEHTPLTSTLLVSSESSDCNAALGTR